MDTKLEITNVHFGTEVFSVSFTIDALPFTSSFDLAVDYFWKTIMIGIFLNIILAVVLRKQPKPL